MGKSEEISQSLAARTRWLFTPKGLPVLISILVGLIVGYFLSGVVGMILATLAGFAVLFLLKRPPFRTKPWQALVIDLTPTVGKLFFSLAFVLPIADYLMLPDQIHNPNTLPKYLSILIALPKNLFTSPKGGDLFPGFAFIVIISIVLMYWGSMNLEKMDHWLLAFGGLLLYTVSPIITGALVGVSHVHIIMAFFAIGYYCAWIGLLLLLAAKVLPRFLNVADVEAASPATGMLNLIPPVVALGLMSHFSSNGGSGHLQLFQLFEFESTHHLVAGVFSSGVAAVSSAVIVGQADTSDGAAVSDTGEIGPPPEEPPDVPESDGQIGPPPEEPPDVPDVPPVVQGALPSTDPKDPPGTTVEHNPDGSITKRGPGGIWGIIYTDGTRYGELPDGSSYTEYPDGTTKVYSPEGGLEVTQPNGDEVITTPEGLTSTVTHHEDGSVDIQSGYGGNLHIPKDGSPQGSLTTADGGSIVFHDDGSAVFTNSDSKVEIDKDGSGTVTTPVGKMQIDKDGNITSADIDDGKGYKFKMEPDGRINVQTPEGDTLATDEDGLHAKLHDGQFFNTDLHGDLVDGHIKNEDGSVTDMNTDDKGTLHIRDDQGNVGTLQKDGTVTENDADGSSIIADKNGNATITNAEGTRWVTKSNGTGYVQDKKGNRIDLNKDGSVTTTTAGKSTTYTADQLKQLKAQAEANAGQQAGGEAVSSTGGG